MLSLSVTFRALEVKKFSAAQKPMGNEHATVAAGDPCQHQQFFVQSTKKETNQSLPSSPRSFYKFRREHSYI